MMLRACDARSPCRGPALQLLVRLSVPCAGASACAARVHADYVFWIVTEWPLTEHLLFWRHPAPPRLDGVLPAFGIGDTQMPLPFPFARRISSEERYRKQGSLLILASEV